MPLPDFKLDFDLQSLAFDRIEVQDNRIAAILTDAGGNEYPYTRDMFFGDGAQPAHMLQGALKEAYRELHKFTREEFERYLLPDDFARWLHAVELENGLFALSYHVHDTVVDSDAVQFILTPEDATVILGMLARPLAKLTQDPRPAIRMAAIMNRDLLRAIAEPAFREASDARYRISTQIAQPKYNLRPV